MRRSETATGPGSDYSQWRGRRWGRTTRNGTHGRLRVSRRLAAPLLVTAALANSWLREGEAPDQPIPSPHTIHVSKLSLPCNFCHIYVDRSRHAGAPALETCMSCHRAIATEREEVRKLTRHYAEKRPVLWVRVSSWPEHVYFSHKRHAT